MTILKNALSVNTIIHFIKESFSQKEQDFTKGSIRKAIFLLAIPMIFEMIMESVFAIVDIFFVSKLGSLATATVGLTEGVLTIVYSLAFGIGMAATAIVARRVGEKNNEQAAQSAAQAILIGFVLSCLIATVGLLFSDKILAIMGASKATIEYGSNYTTLMFASNIVILLIHLLNGIFRGAGNAAIAMRSLLLANAINIILCPIFIHFYGLVGAAMATTIGRAMGVLYQLWNFKKGNGLLQLKASQFIPNVPILKVLGKLSFSNTLQFIIASASWAAMVKIVSYNGEDAVAGYTIAIRLLLFFIMPAFGLSNAAATLVGQNIGAKQFDRAEQCVWKIAKYNALFMACVTLLFFCGSTYFVSLINNQPSVLKPGSLTLTIISAGYIFYGIGMVLMNAFNGAGDSKTPTIVNLVCYWLIQIPLGWFLAVKMNMQIVGVCIAIVGIETLITIVYFILFKRGNWKKIKL